MSSTYAASSSLVSTPPALVRALQSDRIRSGTKWACALALGRIGGPAKKAIPVLRKIADDQRDLFVSTHARMASVALSDDGEDMEVLLTTYPKFPAVLRGKVARWLVPLADRCTPLKETIAQLAASEKNGEAKQSLDRVLESIAEEREAS